MSVRKLPDWLADLANSPPSAGNGLNGWLFKVARHLAAHYPPEAIEEHLRQATEGGRCGRTVSAREIRHCLQSGLRLGWRSAKETGQQAPLKPLVPAPTWPKVEAELRNSIIQDSGETLVDLWEYSPLRLEGDLDADFFLDALFPGNPLLCIGKANNCAVTRPRETFRGELHDKQLIVPSPMTKLTGITLEGRASPRSLDNTGPRHFLVVEFDQGTADEQAALHLNLAGYMPLVIATHSGGKSLHGWYLALNTPEPDLRRFMRYACRLGADPATFCPAQFVRLPQGRRDNGRMQAVCYFNPELLPPA